MFCYNTSVKIIDLNLWLCVGRVGTKRSRSIDVKNDVSPVPSKKIKTLNPGNEKSSDPVSTVQERTSAKVIIICLFVRGSRIRLNPGSS